MAAILHPVQCAVGPNDDPKWIVERRMLGELAICRQSLNTCSRQSGDSAWRWLWLEKRCGDRGRGKPYKLSAVLLSSHMFLSRMKLAYRDDAAVLQTNS